MNERPVRVFVRTAQDPAAKLGPFASTRSIGGNQGNLLFQFSTMRALSARANVVSPLSYSAFEKGSLEERAEWLNSECDHLVLPLPNSFRLQVAMQQAMDQWAALIERLSIPVTVVGVGTQLTVEAMRAHDYQPRRVSGTTSAAHIAAHEATATRFVRAVLDRSASIGVRGEATRGYLLHLGFPSNQIDVIGCPSVFMWGPSSGAPTRPVALTRLSRLMMSFDHRIPGTADLLTRSARGYPRLRLYAQDDLTARLVITGEDTRPAYKGDARFPVVPGHELLTQHRVIYYPSAWAWIQGMKRQKFSFGPRLHGTVAAVLAGTPAHLLVHDSRTLELADYHALPHTLVTDLTPTTDVARLAEETDFSEFTQRYPDLFGRFCSFLERNELAHAYSGQPHNLAAFDAAAAETASAAPVASYSEDTWLRRLQAHLPQGTGVVRRIRRRLPR